MTLVSNSTNLVNQIAICSTNQQDLERLDMASCSCQVKGCSAALPNGEQSTRAHQGGQNAAGPHGTLCKAPATHSP